MRQRYYPLYFSFGALLLYTVLFVIPGLMGIYYSFTDWNSYTDEINFIGWDNFKTVFSTDENYLLFIKNTLIFTIATIIFKTLIGFALALMVNQNLRFKNFHRVVMFLPAVVPMLVVGLIFKSVLHPGDGLLNDFLGFIGLEILTQHWLTNLDLAFKSIIAVDVWKGVGYIMIILLAGLQTIPTMYYEAAEIDGARFWGKLKHITIPLLMPAIMITTVLNILYGLKIFDTVYVLTNGGPGYQTEVLYTAVFKEFALGRYGVGTALSTVLFLFMVFVGYFAIRMMSKENEVSS